MRVRTRRLGGGPLGCEDERHHGDPYWYLHPPDPYVRCPRCGYRTHVDATPRGDDQMTCAACYTVFRHEEDA